MRLLSVTSDTSDSPVDDHSGTSQEQHSANNINNFRRTTLTTLTTFSVSDVDPNFKSQHAWHFRNDAAGFSIVKPYFLLKALLDALQDAKEGELVALVPQGFVVDANTEARMNAWMGGAPVAVTPNANGTIECDGCKRDVYALLDLNADGCLSCSTRYDHTVQASASLVACRVGFTAIRFVSAWLTLCGDRRAVNHDADVLAVVPFSGAFIAEDEAGTHGPSPTRSVRPPTFQKHTQAQAVLSLLAKKWNVPIRPFMPNPPPGNVPGTAHPCDIREPQLPNNAHVGDPAHPAGAHGQQTQPVAPAHQVPTHPTHSTPPLPPPVANCAGNCAGKKSRTLG